VISNTSSGGSSFSSTGKLVVQFTDGTRKHYFMKARVVVDFAYNSPAREKMLQ
jgi:hypothetical protein